MAFDAETGGLSSLTRTARTAPLATALTEFCAVVSGRDGYLAGSGAVLRAAGSPLSVLTATGDALSENTLISTAGDPVLDGFGLDMVRITGDILPPTPDTALAALELRVGFLGRILDLAHAHLRDRVSFGQKTLSHQLVKAGFADGQAAMDLYAGIARLRREAGIKDGIAADHAALTAATQQAEKLMGGHGYLAGGTHAVGYISMLTHAIYGAVA